MWYKNLTTDIVGALGAVEFEGKPGILKHLVEGELYYNKKKNTSAEPQENDHRHRYIFNDLKIKQNFTLKKNPNCLIIFFSKFYFPMTWSDVYSSGGGYASFPVSLHFCFIKFCKVVFFNSLILNCLYLLLRCYLFCEQILKYLYTWYENSCICCCFCNVCIKFQGSFKEVLYSGLRKREVKLLCRECQQSIQVNIELMMYYH